MHARMKKAVVAVLVTSVSAALLPVAVGVPALAQHTGDCGLRCGGVTPTEDGLLGRVRADVNTLNRYEGNPEPCTWTDAEGVEHQGYLQWRLTAVEQEDWDLPGGTVRYRLECFSPEMGEEFGDLIELGDFQVTPRNLAELALDEFFLGLPAPEPHFSPAGPTMVDLDTWLWVDNIPEAQVSEEISVPGIAVQAFAVPSGVEWDMGDGTVVQCEDSGTAYVVGGPASQTSDCTHIYERSSAEQDGAQYQGSATIVWTGTYTVNGVLAPVEFPIPRETPFALGVEEAQAINTDRDG